MIKARWDRLNDEFDKKLDGMSDEDWRKLADRESRLLDEEIINGHKNKKCMKKLKGFKKLTLQVFVLSASMILISFFADTILFHQYFEFYVSEGSCNIGVHTRHYELGYNGHYHYNYRGFVYLITGVIYFILSIISIMMSHKEKDFK